MDEIDRKILDILEEDARKSYTEIGEQVDVSEGTVRNRVDKMMENDTIRKFSIERGMKESKAVVMAGLETDVDIGEVVESFPSDIKVMEIAGSYDLVIEIEEDSNPEINSKLDEIRSTAGVEETETYMVLNQRS